MGTDLSKLKLECLAIGSVPHNSVDEAINLIKKTFNEVPFWPQMVKVSKNEDMILQYLEGMPSFFSDKSYLDMDYDEFYDDLEQFFTDYESIITKESKETVMKYGISEKSACAFQSFLDIVKTTKPLFAKGQIVGPFTLATTLVDKDGRCVIYDETLKEIIVKTLTLKAIWQIEMMKQANPALTPIIFIDEPSISQLGTSAYVTISEEDVKSMLSEISDTIKDFGGLSAIHCCGKCDWTVPILSGVDMINLDAFSFAENLSLFSDNVAKFMLNGGKIVWGVIPTLDQTALEKMTLEDASNKFQESVNYLTKRGIDEKLVIDNSLISTSCGAGSLSVELAEKAFELTKELSLKLKEMYR